MRSLWTLEFQSLNDTILYFHFQEAKQLANQKIREGDYVLIYLDARRTYMIKMQAGQTFHTHKGYLKLDELIGKEYGEPIKSSLGIYFTTLKPSLNRLYHEILHATHKSSTLKTPH